MRFRNRKAKEVSDQIYERYNCLLTAIIAESKEQVARVGPDQTLCNLALTLAEMDEWELRIVAILGILRLAEMSDQAN